MAVYKRGKTWTAQISWYTFVNGKKKKEFKTKGGFHTKAEAQLWESKQNIAKSKHRISNKNPIFVNYFWDWAKTYRLPGKAPATIRRYKYAKRVAEKYLGCIRLDSLNVKIYQQFLNEYGSNKAQETVVKTVRLLNASLYNAYDDGLIANNFARKCKIIYDNSKAWKVQYLSINEMQRLISQLKSNLKPKYVSRYMILTGLYTGMRIGEVMGLKWGDINELKQTIHIERSWNYIDKKMKQPKTPNSVRTIKVNKSLIDILNQLKVNHHQLVFAYPDGSLPSDNAVNKCLKYNLNKIGIHKKHFHFHSLRHCHVAYLHAMHVDWFKISQRLGHKSVAFTMSQYAYLIDEMSAQEDEYMTKVLSKLDQPQSKLKVI